MERGVFEEQLRALPAKPGVYLFKDEAGKVLYVGKAASLRQRVRSYFSPAHTLPPKVQKLAARLQSFDFVVTDSEQEAIILESNLIKKYRPPFNVNLKDDKSYPYIKVSLSEDWPRVLLTRRFENDGGRYFGPYASARSVRMTLDLLKKLFRYCSPKSPITGTKPRPCLEFHIGRCAGACSGEVTKEEYREMIDQVVLFLEGKHENVVRNLRRRMEKASTSMEFEKAASIRDQLQAVRSLGESQKISSTARADEDVIAIARDRVEGVAQVFFVRSGKLIGKEHFTLRGTQDEEAEQIMASFLKQFYVASPYVPARILLQVEPQDMPAISKWLQEQRGRKVNIKVPRRGESKRLVDLVAENAVQALAQARAKWLSDTVTAATALGELQERLRLPAPPRRVECYDISSIAGTSAVGSMVVFENGRPRTSLYRRFRIRTVPGIDDYAMMQEVLRRRFRRTHDPDHPSWEMPDLVVIDGGKGHLKSAREAMRELGVDSVPVASIAKENEDIFVPDSRDPLSLPRDSQALYLLQRMRDEAHRFALSYHHKLRRKTSMSSVLEVPGIGPKRRRALLSKFGSARRIKEAPVEEIAAVPGMTRPLARRVKQHLQADQP